MPSGVLSVLMMMDGVTKNLTEGELSCFCYCIMCDTVLSDALSVVSL